MKKLFDIIKLEALVESKDVSKRKHPTKDLYIYSYSKTWYPEWSETLKWARGLVLDSSGTVIACPFKKFFNYGEIKAEVDNLEKLYVGKRIQEKLDGSLGILFWYDGEWILSTRGSFESDQCIKGKEILDRKYPGYKSLNKSYTYLFEIIYPENQIVIRYNEDKMVLLAIMDPVEMQEVDPRSVNIPIHFDVVKHFKDLSLSDIITDMSRPDYCSSEGFVVIYDDVFGEFIRVKFKYDEYVKLHRIVSDFKPESIIELLREKGNIDELIGSLPDEFKGEIEFIAKTANFRKEQTLKALIAAFLSIATEDKKTFALENIKKYDEYKAILFEMWKDYYQRDKKVLTMDSLESNELIRNLIFDILSNECKQWAWTGKTDV